MPGRKPLIERAIDLRPIRVPKELSGGSNLALDGGIKNLATASSANQIRRNRN